MEYLHSNEWRLSIQILEKNVVSPFKLVVASLCIRRCSRRCSRFCMILSPLRSRKPARQICSTTSKPTAFLSSRNTTKRRVRSAALSGKTNGKEGYQVKSTPKSHPARHLSLSALQQRRSMPVDLRNQASVISFLPSDSQNTSAAVFSRIVSVQFFSEE
jgi:hypothetical protein